MYVHWKGNKQGLLGKLNFLSILLLCARKTLHLVSTLMVSILYLLHWLCYRWKVFYSVAAIPLLDPVLISTRQSYSCTWLLVLSICETAADGNKTFLALINVSWSYLWLGSAFSSSYDPTVTTSNSVNIILVLTVKLPVCLPLPSSNQWHNPVYTVSLEITAVFHLFERAFLLRNGHSAFGYFYIYDH